MKKYFLFIIALLCAFGVSAQTPTDSTNISIDKITSTPKPNPARPRTLTESDIEAEYYNGVVSFWFNTDLGVADIIITNTSTGESWVESMNGTGATIVMLNNTPGYYVINIYTDNGDYYGEFFVE